jgi:hypothetical protein
MPRFSAAAFAAGLGMLTLVGNADAQAVKSRVWYFTNTCNGLDQQEFDSFGVPANTFIIDAQVILNEVPTSGINYAFVSQTGGSIIMWMGKGDVSGISPAINPGFHQVGLDFVGGGFAVPGVTSNTLVDLSCNSGHYQGFVTYHYVSS